MMLTSPRGFIKQAATNICTTFMMMEENEETMPGKVKNRDW